MIRAFVQRVRGVGYVAFATIYNGMGDRETYTLRNFGDYHSAATEFRDFINRNNLDPDRLERLIKGWAASYRQDELYTYPEVNARLTSIILRKQRKFACDE